MIELYSLLHNWFYNVTFNEYGWGFWHLGEQSIWIPLVAVFLFLSAEFYSSGWPKNDDEWWYVWIVSIVTGVTTGFWFPTMLVLVAISLFSWAFFPWLVEAGERKRQRDAIKRAEDARVQQEVERIFNAKE